MTYFILANPHSGAQKGQRTVEILIPYLKAHQIDHKLFSTTQTNQEAKLIQTILSQMTKTDRFLVIGGDGTLSLVIDHWPKDLPFSYLPAGSGNDFARSLGISLDPITAFLALEHAKARELYLLKYSAQTFEGYALNNIGIGLDAAIVKATNHSRLKTILNKVKLGQLAYLMSALHVLFSKKPFEATLSVLTENQITKEIHFNRAFLMTFTKHPYFGGGLKISPQASNHNADIHLVEVERHPLPRIFTLIPKLLKATHLSDPKVFHTIASQFTIQPQSTQPVQIDGETYTITKDDLLTITTEKRTIFY